MTGYHRVKVLLLGLKSFIGFDSGSAVKIINRFWESIGYSEAVSIFRQDIIIHGVERVVSFAELRGSNFAPIIVVEPDRRARF